MVKYKGRAKGKVHMPKKPVKVGFKFGAAPVLVLVIYVHFRCIMVDP